MYKYFLCAAIGLALATPAQADHFDKTKLSMKFIGQYQNPAGAFDEGAAEIVTYDAALQRLFVVNAHATTVDVLDINDPANPGLIGTIDASQIGGSANSVAVHNGIVAVAIEASNKQAPGRVAFYNASDLGFINSVEVGALPDMVTFTPNGRYVLVANEGEPGDGYGADPTCSNSAQYDPEGSVSIIDIRHGPANAKVRTADFKKYIGKEAMLRAKGVRIFGPCANAAQDLEPEYITVSENSRYAWVSLQEANTMALIDIHRARVKDLLPLGTKDHSLQGNELDPSDRDGGITLNNWPVQGMYMPDAIASYMYRGRTYIVTANEGDSRDYDDYSEEARVKDLVLDADAFPNAADLQQDANLGRLKTTLANGDIDNDGDHDVIYSYGARSFSIWTAAGKQVYDSGADIENITAAALPNDFNSNNDENDSFDKRSDDKGPEPEGVVLGRIGHRTIAFIGLERVGGIMAYDVTNPYNVSYLDYINYRDFSVDAQLPDGKVNPLVGDLGPEGLAFISASESPTGKPMVAVGNEISGTTTLFEIDVDIPRKAHEDDD